MRTRPANRTLVEADDKQHGKIDAWRSENPARIETEIEASIIGLLIQHWATVLGRLRGSRAQLKPRPTSHAMGRLCAGQGPDGRDVTLSRYWHPNARYG